MLGPTPTRGISNTTFMDRERENRGDHSSRMAPKSPSGSSNASGSLAGAGALFGLAGAAGAVC